MPLLFFIVVMSVGTWVLGTIYDFVFKGKTVRQSIADTLSVAICTAIAIVLVAVIEWAAAKVQGC